MTAGAVDPSGNLWVTNNWKIDADPFQNPGGNAVVILIGAAAPEDADDRSAGAVPMTRVRAESTSIAARCRPAHSRRASG